MFISCIFIISVIAYSIVGKTQVAPYDTTTFFYQQKFRDNNHFHWLCHHRIVGQGPISFTLFIHNFYCIKYLFAEISLFAIRSPQIFPHATTKRSHVLCQHVYQSLWVEWCKKLLSVKCHLTESNCVRNGTHETSCRWLLIRLVVLLTEIASAHLYILVLVNSAHTQLSCVTWKYMFRTFAKRPVFFINCTANDGTGKNQP